jgi:SAM-dependent methyltransferase
MNSAEDSLLAREDRYDSVLARLGDCPTLRSIYRDVYGAEYPAEADPFGFVTVSELSAITHILAESGVTKLLDVGCGRGGPGLWIARDLGASLVGIDIVPAAVAAASERAASSGVRQANFYAASATNTGLPAAGFDGIVSIDALWMVVDKHAAFRELARVLCPGGRLVFTTWEPVHLDYSWYLGSAGFESIAKQVTQGSAEQIEVFESILRNKAAIVAELGVQAAEVLFDEATETPAMLGKAPRIIVSAKRRQHG